MFHWGTSASTKVPMLIPVVTVSNVWIFKNRLGGHYVPLCTTALHFPRLVACAERTWSKCDYGFGIEGGQDEKNR